MCMLANGFNAGVGHEHRKPTVAACHKFVAHPTVDTAARMDNA